mgnify:CR=1 FL=1
MILGSTITVLVGCVCIILGISNMQGNISSLHEYHRHRVSDDDVIPFGKLVGLGTIIIGASVIIFSISMLISHFTSLNYLLIIGTAVMFIGIAIGIAVSFYAMKKYNNGIF